MAGKDYHTAVAPRLHPAEPRRPAGGSGKSFWQRASPLFQGQPRTMTADESLTSPPPPAGQRRHRQRQPQTLGTLRILHPRVLPLPAGALEPLETVLDPGAHPIPAHVRRLGRKIGNRQPAIGMPVVPTSQQRARQTAVFLECHAPTLPPTTDLRHQRRQRDPMMPALRPETAVRESCKAAGRGRASMPRPRR